MRFVIPALDPLLSEILSELAEPVIPEKIRFDVHRDFHWGFKNYIRVTWLRYEILLAYRCQSIMCESTL